MLVHPQDNARADMSLTQIVDQLVISCPVKTTSNGTIKLGHLNIPCKIGKSNIRHKTREGNGSTPAGIWHMVYVLYRADRIKRPKTALTCFAIRKNDSWCDNQYSRAYNLPLAFIPEKTEEALWRDDHLYDVIVIINHNSQPAIPGLGSAIFIHTSQPDRPYTQGCVAVEKNKLLRVLSCCDQNTNIVIQS
jgi:L,D-peptidoglycan transpeptidase YkuD (ErfK/YbiS/YcfS/YnhG family)